MFVPAPGKKAGRKNVPFGSSGVRSLFAVDECEGGFIKR